VGDGVVRARQAEVLIGSYDPDTDAPLPVRVDLRGLGSLPFLARADRISVASFRVGSSGEEPVSPQALPARRVSLHGGAGVLTIDVRPHEVVLVRLSRA
jgi:hypothetical protein